MINIVISLVLSQLYIKQIEKYKNLNLKKKKQFYSLMRFNNKFESLAAYMSSGFGEMTEHQSIYS